MDDLLDVNIDNWTLKLRVPPGEGPHPAIFLIHGWTGDERSMWVFAPRLPKDALLIAPRAQYRSKHHELGGYSWVESRAGEFSSLPDFDPALDAFDGLIDELSEQYSADFTQFGLVGFSQGAAFSFAYALRHPERIGRLAALAGFLPAKSEPRLAALAAIPVFIAHGTHDETVPVARAQEAKSQLQAAGVRVQYCESDTGHKLGANCSSQLAEFFQ